MKRLLAVAGVLIVGLIVALLFAGGGGHKTRTVTTPGAAVRPNTRVGAAPLFEVIQHCGVTTQAAVDPLVHFGEDPTAHSHTAAGAGIFGANETLADMLAAPSTNCQLSGDRTEFWAPTTLQPDGTPASIVGSVWYLTNTGFSISPTVNIQGLRYVNGSSTCHTASCSRLVYKCGIAPFRTSKTIPTADFCGGQTSFDEFLYTTDNQCWDGVSLGQGMGASDPPNVIGTNLVDSSSGQCPGGQSWTPVPGTLLDFRIGADGLGGCLSSDIALAGAPAGSPCSVLGPAGIDPGASGHYDFVLGMTTDELNAIISQCLDATGFTGSVVQPCRFKAGTSTLYQVDPTTDKLTTPVTN